MRLIPLSLLFLTFACTTSHELRTDQGKSRQAQADAPWKRFLKKSSEEIANEKTAIANANSNQQESSAKYVGLIQALDYKQNPEILETSPSVGAVPRTAVARSRTPALGRIPVARAPTLKVLAAELKLSEKELRSQTAQLDKIVRNAKNAENACKGWQRRQNLQVCEFVSSLSRVGRSKPQTRYQPFVALSPQKFSYQQRLSYSQIQKSLHKTSSETVLSWVPEMLKSRGCPRNISAVSVRKLENLLPSAQAKKYIEQLYLHAAYCMKPTHPNFEHFHFRQALLRYSWGDKTKARLSIELAAKAKHYYERERVLYWAGLWSKIPAQQTAYWQELVDDYPLAYHTLEAWRHMGEDPYLIYTQRPDLTADRKVKRLKGGKQAQDGIYWLEALYITGNRFGASRLASRLMDRFQSSYTAANIYYVASLKHEKNNTLATIGFLSGQIGNEKILNEQTLKMLFPRPYYRQFEKAQQNSRTDSYLLLAVTRQESAFNPRARSSANARGLMQILPTTAQQMTGKRWNDLYSPTTNVQLGAKYMSGLIHRFGAVEKALAAYNAGPSRVSTWNTRYQTSNLSLYMDLIPFKETRNYVSKILRNNYWYERIYEPSKAVASLGVPALQKSTIVDRLLRSHRESSVAGR